MATVRHTGQLPDLDDELLYPRLSPEKIDRLAEKGRRRSFAPGETLYEHGERDAPFFVLERGLVEFVEHKPGKEILIARADAGTGYELFAITAVVLGGTSIFGGRGSVTGTLLGVAVIAVLKNGLASLPMVIKMNATEEMAGLATGALLLVALIGSNFAARGPRK